MKNTPIKPIKIGKQSETQTSTQTFRPEKLKKTNKVLWEKSHCVVYRSNKSRFLKQKIN